MKKELSEETSKNLIHDKDIREPLFDFLEETYGKIRIFEEKMMGRSRADVVMVMDNAICGLEIKSNADSYARLSRQIKDYDKYYDYNIAVVGTKHAGSKACPQVQSLSCEPLHQTPLPEQRTGSDDRPDSYLFCSSLTEPLQSQNVQIPEYRKTTRPAGFLPSYLGCIYTLLTYQWLF